MMILQFQGKKNRENEEGGRGEITPDLLCLRPLFFKQLKEL